MSFSIVVALNGRYASNRNSLLSSLLNGNLTPHITALRQPRLYIYLRNRRTLNANDRVRVRKVIWKTSVFDLNVCPIENKTITRDLRNVWKNEKNGEHQLGLGHVPPALVVRVGREDL